MEKVQSNSINHDDVDSSSDDFKSMNGKSNESSDSEKTCKDTNSYASVELSEKSTVKGELHLNNVNNDENANRSVDSGVIETERSVPATNSRVMEKSVQEESESSGEEDNSQAEESEEVDCLSSDNDERSSGEESDLEDNTDLDDVMLESTPLQKLPNTNLTNHHLRQRQLNPKLPETVTVLETGDGSKVYLVGTAHFSLESQEDVATTILATQPDIVMVELCNSRVNILALDEKTILEESKNLNFEKMRTAIKQNGVLQGAMYLLLLSMSAHITKELGMAPGGEFRRAFTEARKIPGCLVHLGDRPIQITLKRALSALSCWQKMRLAWYMITNKQPISKEEVERCKRRDLLEELLAEMTGEFPALSTVFVKERDTFLAYSLRLAATPVQSPDAPNGVIPTVVVGVVGIGHVSGIVQNWNKVTEADISPILSMPEPSRTSRVIRASIRYSLMGLAIWGCYRFVAPRIGLSLVPPKKSVEWLTGLLQR